MHANDPTAVVQAVIYVLMSLFALGVVGGIVTNVLILLRTRSMVTLPEERDLRSGDRRGRQFSRASSFFIDGRFRRLRLAMACSIGLSVCSFALMLLVDALFR